MINVEIGKQYSVSNRWKKSFVENTYYTNVKGDIIERIVLWRQGDVLVTPQTQEEVNLLIEAQDEEYEGVVDFESFEEFEFGSCWDGISEEYFSKSIVEIQDMFEEFYEDDELQEKYFGFDDYLEEELKYELDYCEQTIEGSILVEEV